MFCEGGGFKAQISNTIFIYTPYCQTVLRLLTTALPALITVYYKLNLLSQMHKKVVPYSIRRTVAKCQCGRESSAHDCPNKHVSVHYNCVFYQLPQLMPQPLTCWN